MTIKESDESKTIEEIESLDTSITKEMLDKDFAVSANRLVELMNGRLFSDIPLADEYWIALKKHQAAFGSTK